MFLGVDIGSSSSKAVVVDKTGRVVGREVVNIGTGSRGPQEAVNGALSMAGIRREEILKCVATGYGRMTFAGADRQITEISCHAMGVRALLPEVRTIIDVGGQDAKVIRIAPAGNVENFVMNEKCAAGTGRFLEVVARIFGCDLCELSDLAEQGEPGTSISSTCTVFAESEMISHLSEGKKTADVALGAHRSIAERIAGLCSRVAVFPPIAMTGGVALNKNVVKLIGQEVGHPIISLEDPQAIGALGAAIYAKKMLDGN